MNKRLLKNLNNIFYIIAGINFLIAKIKLVSIPKLQKYSDRGTPTFVWEKNRIFARFLTDTILNKAAFGLLQKILGYGISSIKAIDKNKFSGIEVFDLDKRKFVSLTLSELERKNLSRALPSIPETAVILAKPEELIAYGVIKQTENAIQFQRNIKLLGDNEKVFTKVADFEKAFIDSNISPQRRTARIDSAKLISNSNPEVLNLALSRFVNAQKRNAKIIEVNGVQKTLKLNLDHMLLPQFKDGDVQGFHIDPGYKLQNAGKIKILTREDGPGGIYRIFYEIDGLRKESACFPSNWSEEFCVQRILETIAQKIDFSKAKIESNGKIEFRILMDEGFEVEGYITKNFEIKSAFPFIEEWYNNKLSKKIYKKQ